MKKRRSLRLSFLLLIACTSACNSPSDPVSTLHQETLKEGRAAVKEQMEKNQAASVSLAVIDGEQVAWAEAFGQSNKATATPANNETMYGIGSISKMFATTATMKLVDEGKISLDTPLVTYLPSFQMRSPEAREITVRMLLNHSSGLPGTDDRNIITTVPYETYAAQLLLDLQNETLKFPPGYLSVYTNDGFTLIEDLVQAVSGQSFPNYVQEQIFKPLGMTHSRIPTAYFPTNSFAHSTLGGQADPQQFVNAYGSGGIYSTPSDMARFAMVFLGKGAVGSTRILSENAVASMAVDQTKDKFNPVPSALIRFGLGWDSVAQPGLASVGISGWAKGGDTLAYGAELVVAPTEKLAVVVMGTSGISSNVSDQIAERILLRELAARKRIPKMPEPLPKTPQPAAATTTVDDLKPLSGFWARNGMIFMIQPAPNATLSLSSWNGKIWKPTLNDLRLRTDGRFTSDASPLVSLSTVTASKRDYLVLRNAGGYGEYLDEEAAAQRVTSPGPLSSAWRSRMGQIWLMVNQTPDFPTWMVPFDPRLVIGELSGLEGLLVVQPPASFDPPSPASRARAPERLMGDAPSSQEKAQFFILDPSQDEMSARPTLLIPGIAGRDLDTVTVFSRDDEEWIRFGSVVYRPGSTMPAIELQDKTTLTIGPEGYSEWRALRPMGSAATLRITTQGQWKTFGPTFTLLSSGSGSSKVAIPPGTAVEYVLLSGSAGESMELELLPQ